MNFYRSGCQRYEIQNYEHPLAANDLSEQLQHHCPNTPFLIVGTKIDLRDNPVHTLVQHRFNLGPDPVTTEQGHEMAKRVGAIGYLEWYVCDCAYQN
jgi:GTPase SAR1 family protein